MCDLHWSFDYFHEPDRSDLIPIHLMQRPAFLSILRDYLRNARPVACRPSDAGTAAYATLFNFSLAYERSAGGGLPELRAGELLLEKSAVLNGVVQYAVQFRDRTSGEEGDARFLCSQDARRDLKGEWRVSTRNLADGTYDSYDLHGRILARHGGERDIELSLCGS